MNWKFIQNILQFLYHNSESCVVVNGFSTSFFTLVRTVGKDLICTEVLTRLLKSNIRIEHLLARFADETTLTLDGADIDKKRENYSTFREIFLFQISLSNVFQPFIPLHNVSITKRQNHIP